MDYFYLAAVDIARRAHEGQLRKYTGEPYLVHPFAVAGLVAAVSADDDMIVAAILHDVVEDSAISLRTINGVFGQRIALMVEDLTDVSKPSDGNRATRRAIDRAHTASACIEAKTIKLADLIDNTKSICAFAPEFAEVYMPEKQLLLEVLRDGDPVLFALADKLVQDYFLTNEGRV